MPTRRQLSKSMESQFEFPSTRRTDDPLYINPEENYKINSPMPDKQLTPIQLLLKSIKDKQLFLPPVEAMSGYAKGKKFVLNELEKELEFLLATEKQFGFKIWDDAIERFCFENGSEFVEGKPLSKSEYFKQYEP